MAAKRDFDDWLSNFRDSIADYEYYVDFNKIVKNVDEIRVELNILNSLVGSKNIKDDFYKLVERYPEVLKCIPILIAVRNQEISAMDDEGYHVYYFDKPNFSIDQYVVFMEKVGLFDLISNHLINNLVDYVTGVETGLDSNARKNRGGKLMEDTVERFIRKTGLPYYKEMYLEDICKRWNIDISEFSKTEKPMKRFDFVVDAGGTIYAFEVNFYTSPGSKLNETARSYKLISEMSRDIDGFEFVWITDGKGWYSTKNPLHETFNAMDNIFCIKELEDDVLETLMKPVL